MMATARGPIPVTVDTFEWGAGGDTTWGRVERGVGLANRERKGGGEGVGETRTGIVHHIALGKAMSSGIFALCCIHSSS